MNAAEKLNQDHINDMLCVRNEELEHDKPTLAAQLDRTEAEVQRLTLSVRRTHNYPGDHLPAQQGLVVVSMLEDALMDTLPRQRRQAEGGGDED